MNTQSSGTELEARIQRLSLAQGVFAERGLVPAANETHRLLATDIDVLATEYTANFHRTLSHFECKGGKIQLLDRILWMKGVRGLLDADSSMLVNKDFDREVVPFAKSLGIELFSIAELCVAEESLKIGPNWWPGRSNYLVFEKFRSEWREMFASEQGDPTIAELRSAFAFLEVDSWRGLDYRILNRLFRTLDEVSQAMSNSSTDKVTLCCQFLLRGLVVRLSQFILLICKDLSGFQFLERKQYIDDKLTFGENNARYIRGLMDSITMLPSSTSDLKQSGGKSSIDTSRLFGSPRYAEDFAKLIEAFISSPTEACFVPVTSELRLFSLDEPPKTHSQLVHAIESGDRLCGLVLGFVIRSFKIDGGIFSRLPSAFDIGKKTRLDT